MKCRHVGMPLHRTESSQQQTIGFEVEDVFVKEHISLSREQVTVFKKVSSTKDLLLKPEFVFKGKGARMKINVVKVNYQWSLRLCNLCP